MSHDKSFNFLLFSDLHSHKYKNFDLTQALSRMVKYIDENKDKLPCDYILIAGDIANKCDYTGTKEHIENLKKAASLPEDGKQRVFWAVGNHDIKRGRKLRERILQTIRKPDAPPDAFEQAMNDEETRMILTQAGMSEYLEAYQDICGAQFPQNEISNAHRYFALDELNLFVLNTCLTSCDNDDNQNLYIAESRLYSMFDKARPNLPTIVLGHHGKEFFPHSEQERLRGLFENRVDMYLCGHLHRAGYSSFDIAPHEIHQIRCGGGAIDGYSNEGIFTLNDTDKYKYAC